MLEIMEKINTLVFDKTGTLTQGKPQVVSIIPASNVTEHELLSIAASLERHSEHPLAAAILNFANQKNIPFKDVRNFESLTGKGVRALLDGKLVAVGNHQVYGRDWYRYWPSGRESCTA